MIPTLEKVGIMFWVSCWRPRRRPTEVTSAAAFLFDSAPLILWWDTGSHMAREEAEGVEATAAGFVVRAARLPIAELSAGQDGAGTV